LGKLSEVLYEVDCGRNNSTFTISDPTSGLMSSTTSSLSISTGYVSRSDSQFS
jgi:hypothetical protein